VEKSNIVADILGEKKTSFYCRDLSDQIIVDEFGRFDYAFCYAVLHRYSPIYNRGDK